VTKLKMAVDIGIVVETGIKTSTAAAMVEPEIDGAEVRAVRVTDTVGRSTAALSSTSTTC
jgi:hypothetical protein